MYVCTYLDAIIFTVLVPINLSLGLGREKNTLRCVLWEACIRLVLQGAHLRPDGRSARDPYALTRFTIFILI